MSVDAIQIFKAGEKLASGADEIDWRNSASRVYYAAYHRACSSVGVCPDNGHLEMGSHERISERFKLHNTKGGTSIAYLLEAMKKLRRVADYEIGEGFEQSQATNQVSQFKALKDRLASFDDQYQNKQA